MHELGGLSPNLSLQSTVAFLALTLLIIIILALQASELRLNLCELGPMLITESIVITKSQAVAARPARPVFDLKWTFWCRGIQ